MPDVIVRCWRCKHRMGWLAMKCRICGARASRLRVLMMTALGLLVCLAAVAIGWAMAASGKT